MPEISRAPLEAEVVKLSEGTTQVGTVKGYRPGGVFVIIDMRGKERMIRKIEASKDSSICWAEY